MKQELLLVTLLLTACTTNGRQSAPLDVVPAVDLARYILLDDQQQDHG